MMNGSAIILAAALALAGPACAEVLTFNCAPVDPPAPEGDWARVQVDTAVAALTYYGYVGARPTTRVARSTARISEDAIRWTGAPPIDDRTVEWTLDRHTGELIATDLVRIGESEREITGRMSCKIAAADKPRPRSR